MAKRAHLAALIPAASALAITVSLLSPAGAQNGPAVRSAAPACPPGMRVGGTCMNPSLVIAGTSRVVVYTQPKISASTRIVPPGNDWTFPNVRSLYEQSHVGPLFVYPSCHPNC